MDSLCQILDILSLARTKLRPKFSDQIRDGEIRVADLVDLAIPTNAQAVAEALGLKVQRSVTSGARVRQIPRDEAEIAVECLRDWGISARILEDTPRVNAQRSMTLCRRASPGSEVQHTDYDR